MAASFTPQTSMPTRPAAVGDNGHLSHHQGLHDAISELRTALTAALTAVAADATARTALTLMTAAADPSSMAVGTITPDSAGAALSHAVRWPDGATGTYTGTASTTFPGSVDSYTITHTLGGVTTTYTQSPITRNSSGYLINRPAITVA
jgi:hypothetical protein